MKSFLFVLSILSMIVSNFGNFLLEYEWKYIDYVWNDPQHKQQAINSGEYNPNAVYLFDVDYADDGRLFVTAIRNKSVPASLMTISDQVGEGGALLKPYPDWSWFEDDCKGITGAIYQTQIVCNHLFVVDGGKIDEDPICPPQLLIFDLSNDKLVKRVIIPDNIAQNKNGIGLMSSVAVIAPNCSNIKDNARVLIGDTDGFGLVIYDAPTSNICRIESEYMNPIETSFNLDNGTSLDFSLDGLFGMTFIGKDLFYATFGGSRMYKLETSKIKCSLSYDETNKLIQLAGMLSGQTAAITSERCAIFFSNIEKTSIMCADATKEINAKNMDVVLHDPKMVQFASGMKNRDDELVILTNKYYAFNGSLNLQEVNFRILSKKFQEIQKTNPMCFASCK
ncbi:major royal jelly protein 1-like [Pseudomyrmex gracilis]|uniref:major royal jelly protein 1-like n=1 Tax=Pseudomyrmex gracilis TaxID=219809 RepID=UPI000995BCCB|nr:major royal jelly protein 1-like [Pseudomyrmex gracilis]